MSAKQGSISPARPDAEERVRRVELIISTLLRTGVIVSFVIIVVGTILSFVHHPGFLSTEGQLQLLAQPGAVFPHTIKDVFDGVLALHGQAIVALGLLLLIATPVVRVAVSIFAFVYQGDRVFVAITTVVLCFLLLSFVLGKVE